MITETCTWGHEREAEGAMAGLALQHLLQGLAAICCPRPLLPAIDIVIIS